MASQWLKIEVDSEKVWINEDQISHMVEVDAGGSRMVKIYVVGQEKPLRINKTTLEQLRGEFQTKL